MASCKDGGKKHASSTEKKDKISTTENKTTLKINQQNMFWLWSRKFQATQNVNTDYFATWALKKKIHWNNTYFGARTMKYNILH